MLLTPVLKFLKIHIIYFIGVYRSFLSWWCYKCSTLLMTICCPFLILKSLSKHCLPMNKIILITFTFLTMKMVTQCYIKHLLLHMVPKYILCITHGVIACSYLSHCLHMVLPCIYKSDDSNAHGAPITCMSVKWIYIYALKSTFKTSTLLWNFSAAKILLLSDPAVKNFLGFLYSKYFNPNLWNILDFAFQTIGQNKADFHFEMININKAIVYIAKNWEFVSCL